MYTNVHVNTVDLGMLVENFLTDDQKSQSWMLIVYFKNLQNGLLMTIINLEHMSVIMISNDTK